MVGWHSYVIMGLLIASIVAIIAPIIGFIIVAVIRKVQHKSSVKTGISRLLIFSGFMIVSLWTLRYAMEWYSIVTSAEGTENLSFFEEAIHSLALALKTFTIDDLYTSYLLSGREIVSSLFGDSRVAVFFSELLADCSAAEFIRQLFGGYRWIEILYGLHVSFLNLAAPIAGGAVIIQVLAGVFPILRLYASRLEFWHTKCYFNELNEASLALVKSICTNKKGIRPRFIFTDSCIVGADERKSELFSEAKSYGVICVRDDIANVVKPIWGKSEYYLLSENELDNLQMLVSLTEDGDLKHLRGAKIYLFVNSDVYVLVEKQVNQALDRNKNLKGDKKPVIIPVRSYRNLVHNLFSDVPLYEPLIHKKDTAELKVTIFGNGLIGTEAFLGAYWFGQMFVKGEKDGKATLTPCKMTVNVVSKEKEELFRSKLDFINPDIRKTVDFTGKEFAAADKGKLKYDNEGGCNAPYCSVKYVQADIKTEELWNEGDVKIQEVLESDYFIVALGSDADNISVAEKIRSHVGKKHFESEDPANKTVIAYAVFDSDIAFALNGNKQYRCVPQKDRATCDIYMHAFGSLEQVYSYENIHMSKNAIWAKATGEAYAKSQGDYIKENKKRSKDENANYNHWANLSRALHVKYKVFSLGVIDTSVFDIVSDKVKLTHEENVEAKCEEYRKACKAFSSGGELQGLCLEMEKMQECFAWLEHRRWNAFTRTMGYQHTDNIESSYAMYESHKIMELKLHPCLLEAKLPTPYSDEKYMRADDNTEKLYASLEDTVTDNGICPRIKLVKPTARIAYLERLSEFEKGKTALIDEIKKEKLELLDELSYNCFKHIININQGRINKELEWVRSKKECRLIRKYKKTCNPSSLNDFKKYDYFKYEFN